MPKPSRSHLLIFPLPFNSTFKNNKITVGGSSINCNSSISFCIQSIFHRFSFGSQKFLFPLKKFLFVDLKNNNQKNSRLFVIMADDDEYFLYNRSWMYNRQFDDGAYNIKFLRGVEAFLNFAISKSQSLEIRCPCVKCKNFNFKKPNEVRDHLLRKGFVGDYYDWRYHYDIPAGEACSNAFVCEEQQNTSLVRNREENPYVRMVHDAVASALPETYHNFFPHHDSPQNDLPAEEQSPVDLFEEPNPQAKQFFEMLRAANNPLYPGCVTYSQMSMIGRMTNLKTDYHCSERLYDEFCVILREALPQPNLMTTGFYDTKKQIAALGLPAERIDCCIKGCMIYWGHTVNLKRCKAKESGDVDLTPHSMLVRTKGERGDRGERLLVTDIDKQIDKMYNDLNDEDLRKGKRPDINKNYLKAVELIAKKKNSSSRVYGLGTADEVFYPERSIFHTPQSDLRKELDELHSATNEFRTYINVQMTENNPNANELQDMRTQLTSMQEAIRRLESQLAGESSRAGEAGGSGIHAGSPGGSHGSHNTRALGGSGSSRIRRGGGNSNSIR